MTSISKTREALSSAVQITLNQSRDWAEFDSGEGQEGELSGLALIKKASAKFDSVFTAWSLLQRPKPASRLAAVDILTPYQPVSSQIQSFGTVAVDNLRATFLYVEKTNDIPMTALYSMIRAAVESTSYGLWMLSAGKNDKLAFLSLRLAYENNEDLGSLGKTFVSESDEEKGNVRKRLIELQQAIPSYRSKDLKQRATTTDVVSNADKAVGTRAYFTGLQVWKSCSGLAHSNLAVMHMLLERTFTGESTSTSGMYVLTSRITFVAGFLYTAVENLEALVGLVELASKPQSHRRQVPLPAYQAGTAPH